MVCEVETYAQLLDWAVKSIGKEGPLYFDCGVIYHNHFTNDEIQNDLEETGLTDVFPIGKKGEAVTMNDILDTFRIAANNDLLGKVRCCGDRSYDHEGFRVSQDGKTIIMQWGS